MTLTSPLPGGVSVDLHPGAALEVNDEKLKGAEFLGDGVRENSIFRGFGRTGSSTY